MEEIQTQETKAVATLDWRIVKIKDESVRALIFGLIGLPGMLIFGLLALKTARDAEKMIVAYRMGVEFEKEIKHARLLAYCGFVVWGGVTLNWLLS